MAPLPGRLARLRRLVAADLGPLRRHRDFRLLYFGRSASYIGMMLTEVAIPYQAYRLTHSSLVVGLVMAVEAVPLVIFAFVGGAIADAADRKRVVFWTQVGLLVTSAALVVNAVLPRQSLAALFVIVVIRGAMQALQRPSVEALLPRLVPRDELIAAAALNSVMFNTAMIAAPSAAGVLIAVAGLPATYGLDVLTFVASLLLIGAVRSVPAPEGAERPSLKGMAEGVRYAFSRQELLGTYGVDLIAMFFGMPMALFPALAERLGGPAVLGLLYAAPSVGSLLTGLTSGWTSRVHRHGLAVVAAASGWGLAIAVFGLARWVPLALVCLALAGAADTVSGLFRTAIWNQTIPDRVRGRLAGIELISYSSGPALSGLESGAVAQLWGPAVSVVSGGIACVVGAVAFAALLPRFVAYDYRTWKRESGLTPSEAVEEAVPVDDGPAVAGGGQLGA